MNKQTEDASAKGRAKYLDLGVNIFGLLVVLLSIGMALYFGVTFPALSLLVMFVSFPTLCKCYGIIVGAFTIFSGMKLFLSGQFFPVNLILPFTIYNHPVSDCCLGWGLLVASVQSRSKIGFGLGIANLLNGVLGLFQLQFQIGFGIFLLGYWGSAISGTLTIGLGSYVVSTIVDSWTKSKAV